MSKEEAKLSKLYSISDLKSYLYKKEQSRKDSPYFRNHTPDLGHSTYSAHVPDIIHIKDTENDINKYPEIMNDILCVETHKRTKYDVSSNIINIKSEIPFLNIEVIEVTDYYHCGKLTSGIFIYKVGELSPAFYAGFEEGDVITGLKRIKVEKTPPIKWDKHVTPSTERLYKYYDINTITNLMSVLSVVKKDEPVIFIVNRDEKEIEIKLNIPYETKLWQRFDVPRVRIKTSPEMFTKNENVFAEIDESNYIDTHLFDNLNMFHTIDVDKQEYFIINDNESVDFVSDVDVNMYVEIETPDVFPYEFKIDEEGNLILCYD